MPNAKKKALKSSNRTRPTPTTRVPALPGHRKITIAPIDAHHPPKMTQQAPTNGPTTAPRAPHTTSNLSISNRLRSIAADGAFVSKVADAFQLPLVANERCGSWYIDPDVKGGSAYFKSTDGHFGEWSFSLRRLNLGVLECVGREGG